MPGKTNPRSASPNAPRKSGTRAGAGKTIEFKLLNPGAANVAVAGDFTQWQEAPVPLKKGKTGVWSAKLALKPGRYEYRYLVDGEWADDPASDERVENPFGSHNALIIVD